VRILLIVTLFLLHGCAFTRLEREITDFSDQVVLTGQVAYDEVTKQGPIVVVIYRTKGGRTEVADYRVLAKPGAFAILLPRDDYRLAAFADRNSNSTYDPGEPAGRHNSLPQADLARSVFEGLDIEISERETLPFDFSGEMLAASAQRERYADWDPIANLNAPAFVEAYGRKGLWQPLSFIKEVRGGVYLLESYDPAKVPILFVHGAGGTPRDWRYFIEHLDHTKYQAWVYYYPSGLSLEVSAFWLNKLVTALHAKYGFEQLVVTAHSVGGLVARRFIGLNAKDESQSYVKVLITIATPWGGVSSAQLGVDFAPYAAPSWRDIAPNSIFLRSLYAETLPRDIEHHLFFAYRHRPDDPKDTDGTVTVASQLEQRVESTAARIHGFKAGHSGILMSASAFERYTSILDDSLDAMPRLSLEN
jgi:pimeloyl-ACP methyl ester carboxylesterase